MLIGGIGIGVGIFIGKHHVKDPGEAGGAGTASESTQDTGLESTASH